MYLYTKDTRSIIISVMALSGIGVLMVYSSTALMSIRDFGWSFHYLWKHIFTVIVGMTTMAILANTGYQRIRPMIYILLGISLLLLFLVFVPGVGVTGRVIPLLRCYSIDPRRPSFYRRGEDGSEEVDRHRMVYVSAVRTCKNNYGHLSCGLYGQKY